MSPTKSRTTGAFGALVIMVMLAAVAGLIIISPGTHAASTMVFEAQFSTPADFYDRFDYGLSGINPLHTPGSPGPAAFHGDHDDACQGPDTDRTVHYHEGDAQPELFWWCAPGGADTGHVMTGVDTLGYNTAWFSPKPLMTNVSQVCWDFNRTQMSGRKWTQVLFVSPDDATRYPSTKGSGGFDLGYTSPEFRQNDPNNGIFPQGGTLAGLKKLGGSYQWFQNQDTWSQHGGDTFFGWPGVTATADKATRYKHCITNQSDGTVRITEETDGAPNIITIPGQIPQGPVKVVFQDDNYDPAKDERYDPNALTWHWDNIQVFTGDGPPPTTTTEPTTTTTTEDPGTTTTTEDPGTTTTTEPTTTTTTPPDEHVIEWQQTSATTYDGLVGTEQLFTILERNPNGSGRYPNRPWLLTSYLGYPTQRVFVDTFDEAKATADAQLAAFLAGLG